MTLTLPNISSIGVLSSILAAEHFSISQIAASQHERGPQTKWPEQPAAAVRNPTRYVTVTTVSRGVVVYYTINRNQVV
ncbi:hypothetical protein GGR58DRAFT_487169 [Xylaria digitata]|nr:hypothetical protein GGR58DRAFT_487169 [Xylaria digitata]